MAHDYSLAATRAVLALRSCPAPGKSEGRIGLLSCAQLFCFTQGVARAAFFSGSRSLLSCPLVGCTPRLRGAAAFAGDLTTTFWTHGCESPRALRSFCNHLFQPFFVCSHKRSSWSEQPIFCKDLPKKRSPLKPSCIINTAQPHTMLHRHKG